MACGLPCITCDVGSATSSVVKNNETGIVIPPRDPEALAAAVMKYAGDPKMMREVGDAGRRAVESSYTAEKMCAEFLKAVT